MKQLNWQRVNWIIEQALAEDIGSGDLTTRRVVLKPRQVSATIVSKNAGIIAGLPVAARVFEMRDAGLQVELLADESDSVAPGDRLIRIGGAGASILEAERTALNLLGRLSGIATQTRAYVNALQGTRTRILDTRKTVPLLRELDKYAVRAGGGQNHRLGLYDMILIKENHIRYAGSIAAALSNVLAQKDRDSRPVGIEVEVRNLDELEAALAFPIQRVMLDNFEIDTMRQAVQLAGGRVELEASGGITLANAAAIAATGVDYISVGALTHSVHNFDLSLLFD